MNAPAQLKPVLTGFILAVALLTGSWFLVQHLDAQDATTAPADPFEQRVRDYLFKHPEVILEALQRYSEQQNAAAANQDQTAVAAHADALFRDVETPVGGNPNGDVTLVEFFEDNCP